MTTKYYRFGNYEIKDCDFIVEATSNEQFLLWKLHSNESELQDSRYPVLKVKWDQVASGYMPTIGFVFDLPLVIQITFYIINDKLIGFYDNTSRVVDRKMTEKYINTHSKKDAVKSNANNFARLLKNEIMK